MPTVAESLPILPFQGDLVALFCDAQVRTALEALLPAYLLSRRWFSGKARGLVGVTLRDAIAFDATISALLLLAEVRYGDGSTQLYALPVAQVRGKITHDVIAETPHAAIAWLASAQRSAGLLYDPLVDATFCLRLLDLFTQKTCLPGLHGQIVVTPTSNYLRLRGSGTLTPRLVRAEQSNSSIIFGDQLILKLFRRVDAGLNPDVEMGRFLTERHAFAYTPPLAGTLIYQAVDSEPAALGILQGYIANQGDAWDYFQAELAQFYALTDEATRTADLLRHGATACLLGRRTAELHLTLANAAAEAAFGPEPLTLADQTALADGIHSAVTQIFPLLRTALPTLCAEIQALAHEILAGESALIARCQQIAAQPLGGMRTRLHGDYHLGQVLFTGTDFVIIDFEGEPARSLSERRAKRSPLRDVAGMLRSFHYAAYAALFRATTGEAVAPTTLELHAHTWHQQVTAAYVQGYLDGVGAASFLPPAHHARDRLLDAYLIEKAIYELDYELNNRPDWVRIPLQGIKTLLQPTNTRIDEDTMAHVITAPGGYVSLLSEDDLYLFNEGSHFELYNKMGAHPLVVDGVSGTYFAVWAPNANYVAVIGDFNGWNTSSHPLKTKGASGIWEGFFADVSEGTVYKYYISSHLNGYTVNKADPFGSFHEVAPKTASIVWGRDYEWNDGDWMATRGQRQNLKAPMSIYEMHLGSWMRVLEDGNRSLSYRELAPKLAEYMVRLGFTHIEFLPLTEHPFFGSWGYQSTGFFAPTSRHGTPQDMMYLIDYLHQHGIGVIMDWVPSHFTTDEHGLGYFDGTHLYEHADKRKGFHPDWGSLIFNYGRNEVQSFLISSAFCWLDKFHIDGLRVDAVASMLYLDYSRKDGEWIPNQYGGKENLEAISFLRRFNEEVFRTFPDVQTIAEESTAWPMVSRPNYVGGLGFSLKWDMGWMHDTLSYMSRDPLFRRFHHNEMTFRMLYAFTENFCLPLSHDEVVHGKGSLAGKMPGDEWQRFANLRLLYSYMYAQPAKKLLFMGGEIGQIAEWNHDSSLEWHILQYPNHMGIQQMVADLNRVYRAEPALHELDCEPEGFEWIDANDSDGSTYSFLRKSRTTGELILCLFNCTPVPRNNYRVGVPRGGYWRELLNSDGREYWGSGIGNAGGVEATPIPWHGKPCSLNVTLPPLGALFFKAQG